MKRLTSFQHRLTALRWLLLKGWLVLVLLVVAAAVGAKAAGRPLLDLNEPAASEEEENLQQSDTSSELVQQEANDEDSQLAVDVAEPGPKGAPAIKKYSWIRGQATRAINAIKSTFTRMPKYFDFNQYLATFNRHYDALEMVFRRAQFLSNCLLVFKARVAYRLGLSSHKEIVNKFSDRSANEIKRMFMAAPPFEMRPAGQSEEEYYELMQQVVRERSHWDLELNSSAAGDDGSDDEPAAVVEEEQAKRRIKRMLEEGSSDAKYKSALHEELGDESKTGAAAEEPEVEQNPARGGWRPLPWPGKATLAQDSSPSPSSSLIPLNTNYTPPQLSEPDSLDWSKHGCFHKVYDQGEQCGKCYVLAATALVEFYKCSERNAMVQPRKFSTNYVLNCGQKFSPTIQGCRGGSLVDTLRFLAVGGTHSIAGWEALRKQRAQQNQKRGLKPLDPLDRKCPLNRFEEPFHMWGSIKVELEPRLVHVNQWHEALQDGPLVASVQMPADIANYQSGTHEGFGCLGSGNWHAMLLVGYGTDLEGRPFWRFRNSWGPEWGDKGHFDLSMGVDAGCLAGGVRVYRLNPL